MPRLLLLASLFLVGAASVHAENWPEFRGPTGQGHYQGKNLPIEWSTTKNVVWKQVVPGSGWSSPIVQDGRIYLTTAVPAEDKDNKAKTDDKDNKANKDGKAKKDKKENKAQLLHALCLDAAKGTILWQTEVFRQDAKAPNIHSKNSHASPTPITDGKHLFVHFGHQGTACLDFNGKIVWRSSADLRYAPVHGNGGTPILVDDRLIFSADGSDKQFICALSKSDGKVIWKTKRETTFGQRFSFSTPLLITVDGKKQIVSPGSGGVMAYDAEGGKEIWRVNYEGYSLIPRPVFGHGMVFISSGYNQPKFMAIRVDGSGDVTESHVAWTLKKGAPHTPSPILVGDEVYMVSDGGLASCLDARTGKVHWQERIGGNYSASPSYCDGKIYFQSEEGDTTVVLADKEFKSLAKSSLKERTFACYAFADGAIFLRTETSLYRIQKERP